MYCTGCISVCMYLRMGWVGSCGHSASLRSARKLNRAVRWASTFLELRELWWSVEGPWNLELSCLFVGPPGAQHSNHHFVGQLEEMGWFFGATSRPQMSEGKLQKERREGANPARVDSCGDSVYDSPVPTKPVPNITINSQVTNSRDQRILGNQLLSHSFQHARPGNFWSCQLSGFRAMEVPSYHFWNRKTTTSQVDSQLFLPSGGAPLT